MPSSEVFHKFGQGKLLSGGSGTVVTNHKQAIAIFESEKRKEQANGGRYPESAKKKRLRGSGLGIIEEYNRREG